PLDAGFGLLVIRETPSGAVTDGRVGPMESDAKSAGLDLDDHDSRLGLLFEPANELAAVFGLTVKPLGRDSGILAGGENRLDFRDEAAKDDHLALLVRKQVLQQVHEGVQLIGADLDDGSVIGGDEAPGHLLQAQ